MDTLLLTCHFLFEQKQLSLQTPCSGGLWVLLTGSDLFTQPRDKVGLPAHPGATLTTITTTTTTTSALPPHAPPPRYPEHDGADGREAGALQYPPSEVCLELRAQGVSPGLIRSSMMKWVERPQPEPAPASNHSSLNWQGSSHGPIGVKSWITFSFFSLSNYLHHLTCSLSHSDYVWLAPSLCYFYNTPSPSTRCPQPPLISFPLSAWIGPHSITASRRPHLYFTASLTEASKFNIYNLQLSVTSHVPLSIFPCFSLGCVSKLFIMLCNFDSSLFLLFTPVLLRSLFLTHSDSFLPFPFCTLSTLSIH